MNTTKNPKASHGKPLFLNRRQRQARAPTAFGSKRMRKLQEQAEERLAARKNVTRLSPCPECNGAGLHRRVCGFYLDRAMIQAKTNPNPSLNGMMGWIARSTGSVTA